MYTVQELESVIEHIGDTITDDQANRIMADVMNLALTEVEELMFDLENDSTRYW